MSVFINLFVSFSHFILTYGVFILSLLSNDIRTLFILLILMSIIKFLYFYVGRCILTLYEYNSHFSTVSELLSNTLTTFLDDKRTEEVLINVGLLIILNKLLFLTIYKYYIK
jgi:hypothetical protein